MIPLCFGILPFFLSCNGCEAPDRINFENTSGNEIGVLLDGRDSLGTFNDRVIFTQVVPGIDIETDIIGDQLGGEIAAFTRNRMPSINYPVTFQEGTDVELVHFENEVFLNFTVWIISVDLINTVSNRMSETLDALLWADQYWQQERLGLRLGAVRFVDVTNSASAATNMDYGGPLDTDYFDRVSTFIGYDPGRINIYLIRQVNGSRTLGFAPVDGDQIVMGMYTGAPDILMHQISHCFSLVHVDNVAGFNSSNVAHAGGSPFSNRKYFSEGQTYRVHASPGSAVNDTYNVRPGAYQYDCPDNVSSPRCPAISQRIWLDGLGIAN